MNGDTVVYDNGVLLCSIVETENGTYLTVDIPSISVTLKVGQLLQQISLVGQVSYSIII